jgi:hypothetical protein
VFQGRTKGKRVMDATEKLSQMMIRCGLATGHGDTIDDLIFELGKQIKNTSNAFSVARIEIEGLRKIEARYWEFAPKYDGLLIDIENLRSIIKRADAILAERNDHWSIEGARNALFEGLEETR